MRGYGIPICQTTDGDKGPLMYIRYPTNNIGENPEYMDQFPETMEHGDSDYRYKCYWDKDCREWLKEKFGSMNINISSPEIELYTHPDTVIPVPGTIVSTEDGSEGVLKPTNESDVAPMSPEILGQALKDSL